MLKPLLISEGPKDLRILLAISRKIMPHNNLILMIQILTVKQLKKNLEKDKIKLVIDTRLESLPKQLKIMSSLSRKS